MGIPEPTPQAAKSAISEAMRARAPVNAQDRIFAARLLALAASVVTLSIVVVVLVALPAWLGPVLGLIAGGSMAAVVVVVVTVAQRQHAFSRAGNRLFISTLVLWIVWAEVVWQFSTHSDWLARSVPSPERTLHFVLTAVVGVVPLLAAALVFRLRR